MEKSGDCQQTSNNLLFITFLSITFLLHNPEWYIIIIVVSNIYLRGSSRFVCFLSLVSEKRHGRSLVREVSSLLLFALSFQSTI